MSSTARYPVPAAFLAAACQFVLTTLVLIVGLRLAPPSAAGAVKLVAFATTIVFPLLLVHALGWWRQVGIEPDRVRPTPVFVASLVTAVVFLAAGVRPPLNESLGSVLLVQSANAFGEELLFRGVIFVLLLPLPRWQAIVVSGLLFGAMHLIHGVMGAPWTHAAWQALVTSIAGMMFAAIRYETGSLWLVIVLHMVLNLCMIYSNIEDAAGETTLFAVQRLVNLYELAIAGYVVYLGTRAAAGQGRTGKVTSLTPGTGHDA